MESPASHCHTGITRLLIVEDEALLADVTRRLLCQDVQCIDIATCGAEAVKLIGLQAYDLVLLDLHLPDINGLEILALLRQKTPNSQVIIVSGDNHIDSAIQALRLGAYDYLRKPYEPELLVKTVRNILQPILLACAPHQAEETANKPRVLAQGDLHELNAAQRAGTRLVRDDPIDNIDDHPTTQISSTTLQELKKVRPYSRAEPEPAGTEHFLDKLLMKIPPVSSGRTADEVFKLFERDPNLHAVAVVKDEKPIGLISRFEMVDNMARPYRHELYGRKSCIRFMDPDPLHADIRMGLSELTDLVSNAPARHLISGFIITDQGRYLGLGSVQNLMREVTAMQFEAARYANPLTQLPGNVPINKTIDEYLQTNVAFVAAYFDLDNFKPLNDVFGYTKGDAMILLTARILAENCDPVMDFLGHIGGDDFVALFRSQDWKARCEKILERFDQEARHFFPENVLQAGGYESENRSGNKEFFPLTSLSIGAAEIAPGVFQNHLAVAAIVAEAKKKAKATQGSCLYVNQRRLSEAN